VCEHLEKLLPKEVRHNKVYYKGNMDRYEEGVQNKEELFMEKLESFGLDTNSARIMVLRFVHDLTFEDIATEMEYDSAQLAHYHYQRVIDYLKSRGYR
jgi:hypothetical protein